MPPLPLSLPAPSLPLQDNYIDLGEEDSILDVTHDDAALAAASGMPPPPVVGWSDEADAGVVYYDDTIPAADLSLADAAFEEEQQQLVGPGLGAGVAMVNEDDNGSESEYLDMNADDFSDEESAQPCVNGVG